MAVQKDPRLDQIVSKLKDSYAAAGRPEYLVHYRKVDAYPTREEAEYLHDKYKIKIDGVHDMCISCQAMQLHKYEDQRVAGQTLADPNRFMIPCSYVPNSAPPAAGLLYEQLVESGLDPEAAQRTVLAPYDPVAWAEHNFGFRDYLDGVTPDHTGEAPAEWRLRPWQKEGMRCTSKRLVLRWGRRSGKTFSFCLKILHEVFNMKVVAGVDHETGQQRYKGPKIIVVTPFEAQLAETIFPQLEELLKSSRDLVKEVVGGSASTGKLYKKSPQYNIRFRNGASIIGMIAGTGEKADGSGGGGSRGLSGDIIYSDEVDMVSEETLQAVIKPIPINKPHSRLWMSSTPIGKPGLFKEYCVSNPRWKEIYFPSTMLSNWKNIEDEYVADTPSTQFKAEYLAIFIDDAYGVFKRSWVINAMRDYSYDDTADPLWWHEVAGVRRSECMFVMGIDWNQTHGSEYVVVAFHPRTNSRWVVDAVNVPYEKFSSKAYKDKLFELALKHRVDWIYADKGFGHHLIEDVQLIANRYKMMNSNDPDIRYWSTLEEKIVAVEFGKNIELRDPIDGTLIKRRTKHYLVQNARNDFERGTLFFPGLHDSAFAARRGRRAAGDKKMYQQLIHYVVLKEGQDGKPVYGSDSPKIGDHRLDALMLALAGIHQKKSLYSEERQLQTASNGQLIGHEELHARYGNQRLEDERIPGAQPSNAFSAFFEKHGYKNVVHQAKPKTKPGPLSERIRQDIGLGFNGEAKTRAVPHGGSAERRRFENDEMGNDRVHYSQSINTSGFARRPGRTMKSTSRGSWMERAQTFFRR